MTISPTSLLDSVLQSQQCQAEMSVAVLKKAQDQFTQQGEAMVEMLEQAGAPSAVPLLDTFA